MKLKLFTLALTLIYAGFYSHNAKANDGDGVLNVFYGAGIEDDPYLINNKEELLYLCQCMEKHEEITKGKFFRLTSDIRLNNRILNDEGTELIADTTKLAKWSPIGNGQPLRGYYELHPKS